MKTTPLKVVQDIMRNEGISAFYKGTTSPLAGVAFVISSQFFTNQTVKRYFEQQNKLMKKENIYELKLHQYLIAGAASGFVLM